MSNDLIDMKNLPAEWAGIFDADDLADDLTSGAGGGFPVLSIKGSKFRVKQAGESELLTNDDGDAAPAISVVLIAARKELSKTYYASQFEEGSTEEPDCRSIDGVKPDPDVPTPQAKSCAACPHNQWGSRITEAGSKGKACADYRRVVVWLRNPVPAAVDDSTPMLLRVPAASLKDLASYGKKMASRGVPYRAVVTRLSFDPEVAYPKLVFRAERPLTQEEANVVVEMVKSDTTQRILDTHEEVSAHSPAEPFETADPETVVPPAPAPQEQMDLFDDAPAQPPAAKKKAAKKKAAKKKAAKKTADLDVIEGGKDAPTEPPMATDDDLAGILNDLEGL